jgi:hypothetical protein
MQQANSTSPSMPLMAHTTDFPTIHLVSKSERYVPRTIPVSYFTLTCVNTRSGKKFTEAMHRFKHAAMTMQGYEDAWKESRQQKSDMRQTQRQLAASKRVIFLLENPGKNNDQQLKDAKSCLEAVSGKKRVRFCDTEFNCLIPMLDNYNQPEEVISHAERKSSTDPQKNANNVVIRIAALLRSKKQRPCKFHVECVQLSFYEQYEQSLNELTGTGIHPRTGQWILKDKFDKEVTEHYEWDMALSEAIKIRMDYNKNRSKDLQAEGRAIEKELAEAGRALRGNSTVSMNS